MYKNLYLKRGKDASLLRYHPWVFSGAVARMDDGLTEGEIVRVLDVNGSFLAIGHFQIGSIVVRILSIYLFTIFQTYPIPSML